jgi:hypothetical protein
MRWKRADAERTAHPLTSPRERMEKEREKLIVELKDALGKVKALSGLLPLCASCKKSRNDRGHWEQIEEYVPDRSGAEFTHGLCADCAKQLYAEFFEDPS